jgi:hypothetical protein
MKKMSFYSLLAAGLLGTLSLAGTGIAEERAGAAATSATETRTAPRAGRMSPELQRAIEGGDTAQASALVKKLGLSAGPAGPTHYECGQTSCTCAGAKSCVDMITAGVCSGGTNCTPEQCACNKK